MHTGLWEIAMTNGGVAGPKNTKCYTPAEVENANGSEQLIREREAANAKLKKSACTIKGM